MNYIDGGTPEIELGPADQNGSDGRTFSIGNQIGRMTAGFDEFHQPNTTVELLDENGEEVIERIEVDMSCSEGDKMARACVKQGLKKLEEARKK